MKQQKYKKVDFINKEGGIIPLAKGYALIVPQHSDNKEIMVAIGMLVQIWGLAEMQNGLGDIEKFKTALCAYADKILEAIKK